MSPPQEQVSHLRSWLKAATWRVVATSAIVLVCVITGGDVNDAMKIGGLDFAGKLALFYAHERAWLLATALSPATRAFWKMMSWKVIANLTTLLLGWWVTGNFSQAAKLGPVVLINMGTYAVHEYVWEVVISPPTPASKRQ